MSIEKRALIPRVGVASLCSPLEVGADRRHRRPSIWPGCCGPPAARSLSWDRSIGRTSHRPRGENWPSRTYTPSRWWRRAGLRITSSSI